jgi:hypothetical protein
MKKLFALLFMAPMAGMFFACSEEDITVDELQDLQLATTLTNDSHTIAFYTTNGKFQTGYNAIYFQIKALDGRLIKNATASWQPLMHMMGMSHSCSASTIAKKENAEATYEGYIVFQMASNEMEYWELSLDYTIDDEHHTAIKQIQVDNAPKRVVESFQASDQKRYIIALVQPTTPRVAVNDMEAVLYKMESMTSFVPVDDFTIKIDPRMPSMGNHSSPNNVDLSQREGAIYAGKLNLTMTGYWKLNLQLVNGDGIVLKGEPVTESNESSSIYFELEF